MQRAPLLLALALFSATASTAAEIHGKIVAISDGDTVTVLAAEKHQHKIRLAGIAAPEKAKGHFYKFPRIPVLVKPP